MQAGVDANGGAEEKKGGAYSEAKRDLLQHLAAAQKYHQASSARAYRSEGARHAVSTADFMMLANYFKAVVFFGGQYGPSAVFATMAITGNIGPGMHGGCLAILPKEGTSGRGAPMFMYGIDVRQD